MQAGGLLARFAASVDGNQKIVAAAFHIECNLPIVADDDGADVKAVRGNRRNGDCLAVRNDKRAAYAKRIGRRAGRGGNYQSVGLIGGKRCAVDGGMDGNHGGAVPLQYRYLVERIGRLHQMLVVAP